MTVEAAPKARIYQPGKVLDYTASADKSGGDVVEIAGLCGVLEADVSNGYQVGALVEGVVKVDAKNEAFTAGQNVWFDSDGDPYGGTAGTGAATGTPVNATGDMLMGTAVYAAGATQGYVLVALNKESQLNGRKIGTFSNPESWAAADEWEEKHIGCSLATASKPASRMRLSNLQDQTEGALIARHVQCYSGSGFDVAELGALLVEAGMKGASGVLLASTEGGYAARFKFEDDYATGGQSDGAPTYTGQVSVISLQAQISANPTGEFCAINVDCQAAGAGTATPFDSILHVEADGKNPDIVNLIKFEAASACAVESAGTYSTADGYFLVSVNGSTYRVPFFAAVD